MVYVHEEVIHISRHYFPLKSILPKLTQIESIYKVIILILEGTLNCLLMDKQLQFSILNERQI